MTTLLQSKTLRPSETIGDENIKTWIWHKLSASKVKNLLQPYIRWILLTSFWVIIFGFWYHTPEIPITATNFRAVIDTDPWQLCLLLRVITRLPPVNPKSEEHSPPPFSWIETYASSEASLGLKWIHIVKTIFPSEN